MSTGNSTQIDLHAYHVIKKMPKTSLQVDTELLNYKYMKRKSSIKAPLRQQLKEREGGGVPIRTAPTAAEGRGPWRVVCWLATACTEQGSPETHREPAVPRYHCSSCRSEHRKQHKGCPSEIQLKICFSAQSPGAPSRFYLTQLLF